jgi:hypothetical protein
MDLMPAIIRIVLARHDEWRRVGQQRWERSLIYAAVLSLIPALATLAMVRTSDLPLPDGAAVFTYGASIATVLMLGTAFRLLARMFGSRISWSAGFAVASYGTTPLWLASALLFSPVLVMVTVVSALHALYLYYVGARIVLGIREDEAAIFIMLSAAAAIAITTLLGAGVGSLGLL